MPSGPPGPQQPGSAHWAGGARASAGSSEAICSSKQHLALLPFSLENPKHSQEGKQALYYLVGSEHCIEVIESGLTQIAFSEEPRETGL